jgi:hypothetical protein
MTWEKLSLRWRWEDTDSDEFSKELGELATFFPLSISGSGIVVLILFIACEDQVGEEMQYTWEFGLNGGGGGGNGNDNVGQSLLCATG